MNIKKLLDSMPTRAIQIGGKLHIYLGGGLDRRAEQLIKDSLVRGETVIENGVSRWIEFHPLPGPGTEGSSRYVWHDDGNRIRCKKWFCIKATNGTVSRVSHGEVWKTFESVI